MELADANDPLSPLEESLVLECSHAGAYTAPFGKTLLMSQGSLCLTARVLAHANVRKIKERRWMGVGGDLADPASLAGKRA